VDLCFLGSLFFYGKETHSPSEDWVLKFSHRRFARGNSPLRGSLVLLQDSFWERGGLGGQKGEASSFRGGASLLKKGPYRFIPIWVFRPEFLKNSGAQATFPHRGEKFLKDLKLFFGGKTKGTVPLFFRGEVSRLKGGNLQDQGFLPFFSYRSGKEPLGRVSSSEEFPPRFRGGLSFF